MTLAPNAYKVLQVDPEAEDEVIVAAYRRLARKYHPDTASDPESAARMASINAAWELIGTPEKRAAYDRMRSDRPPTSAGPPGGSPAGGSPARGSAGRGQPSAGPPGGSPPGGSPPGGSPPAVTGSAAGSATPPRREPETVSPDWTSGRSNSGGGYDASMRTNDGTGAAGPPPGRPSGSVLNFGRYASWSLGEIARMDLEYIEWLDRMPIGRPYRDEIDAILRRTGRRRTATNEAAERRGLFRRR
jgi:curved DNA-binding protein CbpA